MTAVQHEDHIRGLEDAISYLELIETILSNRLDNEPALLVAIESVQDTRVSINRILDEEYGAS